jgi:hypothetical protein
VQEPYLSISVVERKRLGAETLATSRSESELPSENVIDRMDHRDIISASGSGERGLGKRGSNHDEESGHLE